MTIYEGSRYEFIDVELIQDQDNGQYRQTICTTAVAPPTLSFTYSIYYCVEFDRIDLLADHFLGDPELWWAIAEANPQWLFWDYLPAGLAIRIPSGIPTS
jgi:hypothetical protein